VTVPGSTSAVADYDLPEGFEFIGSGKVRDLFRTPDGRLLFVASDRISAFDWILPTLIPDKGRILTGLSTWWFNLLPEIPSHATGAAVPATVRGRAMVCEQLEMLPVECVVRGYLAGSGLADYRDRGSICGVGLPPGLREGSELPKPIFTPATKAAVGEHDVNVTFDEVMAAIGQEEAQELKRLSLEVYRRAQGRCAKAGLILADTKFEFGIGIRGRHAGQVVLADEILTPDSSRFWDHDTWLPGGPQPSFDKQIVRDWLTSPASGWAKDSGDPPPPLPDEVVERTRARYVQAYERITGEAFR
jgi:phosphoribosylaminoimidazole-succinocarboxamide synthase